VFYKLEKLKDVAEITNELESLQIKLENLEIELAL
jgi:hypothetical protein